MKMKAKDGKLYAEVTLRDIVENYDVSDSPILAEVKRLYAENSMLRELDNIRMTQVEHCETLTEGIEMFEAENAKLRKRIAELEELLPDSGRWFSAETVEAYVAENAKLMKIVSCLLTCANDTGDCDRCPLNGGTGDWNSEDFCDGLLDSLREVGIEVNG